MNGETFNEDIYLVRKDHYRLLESINDSASYPRHNTRVEMCHITRIPMTRSNRVVYDAQFFLSVVCYPHKKLSDSPDA